MPHDTTSEILNGRLQQLLFSPKGGIEGLLIEVDSALIQISMDASSANADTLSEALGEFIEVKASPDHSPKTKGGAHPVYELEGITKIAGKAPKGISDSQPVNGVVSTIHYARHGEPNGVILESGEFIHTRPHGMKKLKLKVGSRVVAHGETRMTVVGTRLIEAQQVNGVKLE